MVSLLYKLWWCGIELIALTSILKLSDETLLSLDTMSAVVFSR